MLVGRRGPCIVAQMTRGRSSRLAGAESVKTSIEVAELKPS
jgi:hypothetical protein